MSQVGAFTSHTTLLLTTGSRRNLSTSTTTSSTEPPTTTSSPRATSTRTSSASAKPASPGARTTTAPRRPAAAGATGACASRTRSPSSAVRSTSSSDPLAPARRPCSWPSSVCGPAGSWGCGCLTLCVGEMHYLPAGPESYAQLPRQGGVAYAAQESWVQNETIRVRQCKAHIFTIPDCEHLGQHPLWSSVRRGALQ